MKSILSVRTFFNKGPKPSFLLTFLFLIPFTFAQEAEIPELRLQTQLIQQTMQEFSDAVIKADFTQFHSKLAKQFKDNYTPQDLTTAFQVFIDQKMDLSQISKMTPFFNDGASIDKDDILKINGYYNTSPSIVFFEILYYEYPNWKVLSIDVRVNEDPNLRLPTPQKQLELTQSSIDSFAMSLKKKDFTEFHSRLASNFKDKYTASQIQGIFQDFIDKEIDLTPLKKHTPIFHQAPFLDENDILVLEGHYPTEPKKTNFVLKFYERPNWKLLGIDININ